MKESSSHVRWSMGVILLLVVLINVQITRAAVLNQSISLNGSSQYLSIPNSSQTGLGFTGNNTVEGWISLQNQPANGQQYVLFAKYSGAGNQRGYLYTYENNSGILQIVARISSDGTTVTSGTLNVTLATTTWTHVALVYDTSGTVTVVVDGVSQGTITGLATSIYSNTADVTIGYQPDVGSPYFPGRFSLVRQWDTNLATSTINANKCTVFGSAQTNMQAEWSLDGVLTDASGNGNTLTNNNSASFTPSIPSCFGTLTAVRKTNVQSVTSNATLQNDSDLVVTLSANTTYIVDGIVFSAATTTSATPDIVVGFTEPSDAVMAIGADENMISQSGTASPRIVLPPSAARAIHVQGTVTTGNTAGDLQLQWAQSSANSAPTTVLPGSYLRVTAI